MIYLYIYEIYDIDIIILMKNDESIWLSILFTICYIMDISNYILRLDNYGYLYIYYIWFITPNSLWFMVGK